MRTDRELLIECLNQLKHIDEIYGFEPLATTTSLIREVNQALNIPVVSGSAFTKIAEDEEFQKQLLNRWGFTKDGGINCGEQLKIFSLLDWIKEHYR